jgi:hypothetical protein
VFVTSGAALGQENIPTAGTEVSLGVLHNGKTHYPVAFYVTSSGHVHLRNNLGTPNELQIPSVPAGTLMLVQGLTFSPVTHLVNDNPATTTANGIVFLYNT